MIGPLPPAPPGADGQVFERLPAPRALTADDDRFPARLRTIPDCPPNLWIRTTLVDDAWHELMRRKSVAIVGARAASHAGLAIARGLAWELVRRDVVIVSGLARGIDAAAHEGALLGGGETVAVLATGLDACYPPEHESLAAEIASRGALLSEWPANTPPTGWRFPRRNRLLSGLADVVVLVEGSPKSGALHTVNFALDQGRDVMAVPRDPLIPGAEGPNGQLSAGAAVAASAKDVLALLEGRTRPGRGRAERASAVQLDHMLVQAPTTVQVQVPVQDDTLVQITPTVQGTAVVQVQAARPVHERASAPERPPALTAAGLRGRVLAYLARDGALSLETLAARLPEWGAAALSAALMTLEIEGRVHRDGHGCFRFLAPH